MPPVIIAVPPGSELTVKATFHRGLCNFWKLRNNRDHNTRRLARQSVRAFVTILRQLPA